MPTNHKRIFIDLVHSMPPEHFRPSDVPLLARQVAAVAMCEHAAEKMTASGGPVVKGKINPWFSVEQRSAKLVAVLATRLRMSPQSRRDPRAVARSQYRPSFYDTMDLSDANNQSDA